LFDAFSSNAFSSEACPQDQVREHASLENALELARILIIKPVPTFVEYALECPLHNFGHPLPSYMANGRRLARAGIIRDFDISHHRLLFAVIMVGVLEVITILFRPLTLSFRLYGNVFAGENMLESTAKMVPALGWLIPIPFYFLEVLVGLVQALVFMLLTAVFTLLICAHEESPGHAGGHAGKAHA